MAKGVPHSSDALLAIGGWYRQEAYEAPGGVCASSDQEAQGDVGQWLVGVTAPHNCFESPCSDVSYRIYESVSSQVPGKRTLQCRMKYRGFTEERCRITSSGGREAQRAR